MMKLTVTKPTQIEVSFVRIEVGVNYGDEDIPFDFPGRTDDLLTLVVDLETGQIIEPEWPKLETHVYMKVTDSGTYALLGPNREFIAGLPEDYVPHGVVPGEYGDYIDFKITEDGVISNWPSDPDVSEFFEG